MKKTIELEQIRRTINTIDFEILKLLNSRMEFALRTKKLKTSITDSKRESEVIDYIQTHSRGLIEPEFCKKLFREIIGESKRLQSSELRLIGFQGEHGSYAETAAIAFDRNLICISCREVREVFEAVEKGVLHLGIVPVENTLGGTVQDVNEFLLQTSLSIIGEIKLPIRYCLMSLPEVRPDEIKVVFSDTAILSHCQSFLDRNGYEGRPYHDAAAAAKMLLRDRPKGSAVIAAEFAAEFYNLKVIETGIQDRNNNITRFLILCEEPPEQGGDKCSIVFSTEHKAGSLLRVLREFGDADINLTRIESMPNRFDPGNYVFFADFRGSLEDSRVVEVLDRVQQAVPMYKLLGCYPGAPSNSELIG